MFQNLSNHSSLRAGLVAAGGVVAAATLVATTASVPASAATTGHAPPAPARHVTHVSCKGTSTACTASVSLAGGASNERVAIVLPSTGLRLTGVKPNHRTLKGSYLVSDQHLRADGRTYAFTLNAARAPRGSALTFTFRQAKAGSVTLVRCTGSAAHCHARIPIGGGASNKRYAVQLPATDLSLTSVRPSSHTLRGAYSLSRQHLSKGGSEYAFRLNAVQGAPRGSHLTLTFTA
jgi:hypothetical protein